MEAGKNVSYEVKGNELTIKVDLSKNFGLSKSGRTTIIATTSGNEKIGNGSEDIQFGLNVFKK